MPKVSSNYRVLSLCAMQIDFNVLQCGSALLKSVTQNAFTTEPIDALLVMTLVINSNPRDYYKLFIEFRVRLASEENCSSSEEICSSRDHFEGMKEG